MSWGIKVFEKIKEKVQESEIHPIVIDGLKEGQFESDSIEINDEDYAFFETEDNHPDIVELKEKFSNQDLDYICWVNEDESTTYIIFGTTIESNNPVMYFTIDEEYNMEYYKIFN